MHFQKPMLGVPLDWSNPLNKDLVMHLAMNEGHGDVVRDLSMYGNRGTLNGFAFPSTVASGWNPGRTGVGLKFDGSNDRVICTDSDSLDITDYLSIECEIFPTVNDSVVVFKGDAGLSNTTESYCVMVSGNTVRFSICDGIAETVILGTSNVLNKWSCVVCTYDGKYMKVYVNGINETSTDVGAKTLYTSTGNLTIGREGAVSARYFNGYIDHTRIQNRAWTAKEVKDYCINPYQVYLDEEDM